jgi:DNA-binding CsgD family transcriptional regulator
MSTTRERVAACAAEGLSQAATARRVGVSRQRVREVAQSAGIVFTTIEQGGRAAIPRERVAACAAEGLSQAETARRLGVSYSAISRIAKTEGLDFVPGTGGQRRIDPARLAACAAEGMTRTEAARALGFSAAAITYAARRDGLRFRSGHANGVAAPAEDARPVRMAVPRVAPAAPAAPRLGDGLSCILHPRWSPADDLVVLRDRAEGRHFVEIATDMDRGVAEVQQRWHRLRAVPEIEDKIAAHVEAGADADAPWPDPSGVAA